MKFDFGVSKPLGWNFCITEGLCGCTIYEFGPFYFTILRGDCK